MVELSVGSGSMRLFKRFEVAGVPSLETIRVGDDCFANVNEVDLDGLSRLKRVGNVADRVAPKYPSTNVVELTTVAIAGPKVAVAGPRVEIGEERKLEKRKKLDRPHSKKRLWIGVGCVAGLVALILGVVLLIRHIHRSSETNQTLEQLKACLSGMDVSKDVNARSSVDALLKVSASLKCEA